MKKKKIREENIARKLFIGLFLFAKFRSKLEAVGRAAK